MMVQRIQRVGWRSWRSKTDAARVLKKSRCAAPDRLAKYVNVWALALIAGIVAAVYDCRSSRLSSGFGCKNKLLSSEANEDFTASAEQGYTSTN
jgi:hypothetical protein